MNRELLLLILLSPVVCFAQSWAPIGAKWTYTQTTSNPYYTTYTTFESMADTVVGGQSCHMMKETLRTGPSSSTISFYYTYADSGYVYTWQQSRWCTHFNFNAQVGDSFMVACQTEARIRSIDTININGHLRRVFWYDAGSMVAEFSGYVIEGIGHTISMFPTSDNSGFASPLRCYEDTAIGLYKSTYAGLDGTQACEETIDRTAIKLVEGDASMAVAPVLITEGWTRVSVSAPTEVTLYAITGQLIWHQKVTNDYQLDLTSYQDGQYIVSLTQGSTATHTARIIKISE